MLPTHADETTPLFIVKLKRSSKFDWLRAIRYLCFAVPAVILICTSWPRKTPVEPEVYWDVPLVPETDCLGYGTRAYSAKLNILPPAPKDWHKICMGEAPEVEVTGRILEKPAWCNMGTNQTVFGHWIVDFDEPECISSWGQFDDKGCTTEASGFRVSYFFRPCCKPTNILFDHRVLPLPLYIFSAFRRSSLSTSADLRGYALRPPRRRRLARHVPPHACHRARHQVYRRDALLS
uniref:Expressed protein n=1 Tax=Schizophyllum commune (strain H4-8 / FGSC 9210) TaxID=578458 RepID=D8QEW0_SCHCM